VTPPPKGASPDGFFAYEDGELIGFSAGAALPPVCFKCGKQRGVRYFPMKFTMQRSYGADVAKQIVSGTRTYVTQRGRIPVCTRCRTRRWIGPAIGLIGLAMIYPFVAKVGPRDLREYGLWAGILVAAIGFYRGWAAGLKPRRVDEDGVIALFGVHRIARADVLAASEGKFVPDEESP
jgi:hypothetical protein